MYAVTGSYKKPSSFITSIYIRRENTFWLKLYQYVWHFKRTGITALAFKKPRTHFKSDVLPCIAKLPIRVFHLHVGTFQNDQTRDIKADGFFPCSWCTAHRFMLTRHINRYFSGEFAKYLFCPFSRERMNMRKQESKDLLGLLLFIIYSLSKPSEGKKDSLLIEAGYKTRFIMQFSVLNIITLIAISVKADSKCLEIRKLCFTMLQTTVSEMIGLSNWCFLWS